MDLRQAGELRRELQQLFPGGPKDFMLFLGDTLNDTFNRNVIASEADPFQFNAILDTIRAARREPDLLEELKREFPASTVIETIYDAERAAYGARWPSAQVRDHRNKLTNLFLVCKGFPIVDRRDLASTLDGLLDPNSLTRVGVVAGTELCGKTWTRHLVQSKCDAVGCTLIDLDLEQIAPGDDVRLLCEVLMGQMAGVDVALRDQDTKSGQYVQRLVAEVGMLRQRLLRSERDPKPLVIAIDSLNKRVGETVLDFVEQLVAATRTQNLKDTKVILFGFPRDHARLSFAAHELISPLTEADVADYLTEVAQVIGRPLPDEERDRVAREAVGRTALPPDAAQGERLRALEEMSQKISEQVDRMVLA